MSSRSPILASPSSTASAVIRFALIGLVITIVVGLILTKVYGGAEERRAILISACIAFPLQVATFTLARAVPREHVMSAWAGGALLRFIALFVYGFVLAKALGLPSGPALISFAAFLFVLTLIEPLLLKS
jgi:hypothetical protein